MPLHVRYLVRNLTVHFRVTKNSSRDPVDSRTPSALWTRSLHRRFLLRCFVALLWPNVAYPPL